jgi:hypothetical protein
MREIAHLSEKDSAVTDSAGRTKAPSGGARRRRGQDASAEQWLGSNADPDVLLSVPDLSVDKVALQVKELRADIDVQVRVLDILDLRVGAHVTLGEVDLDIENVAAQAMLKVRLDEVAEMVDQVLRSVRENPALVSSSGTVVNGGAGRRPSQDKDVVQTSHRVDRDAKPARKRTPGQTSAARRKRAEGSPTRGG